VTGGGGFLGGHVLDRLRKAGCSQIVAPSRRAFDLTKNEVIKRLFEENQPQIVIHLAAAVGGIGANRDNAGRFFYENAIMGIQLIEAARHYASQKLVVIGTICAYPRSTRVPFREEDLWNGYPEPVTAPYGLAKKALLVQCQAYREQYGTNAIFLLPVNLYGPRDHFDLENSHVIPAIIRKCVDARENGDGHVVLWGDGSATREFLFAADAAEGIIRATESYNGSDPVNLGTGIETPIRDLAHEIADLVGFKGRIVWDTSKPNGQPRRCLDVSRAEREFGFRAKTTLRDGLRNTIDWYLATRVSLVQSSAIEGRY
jgi:GDP-L-fucose synthase